MSIPANLYPGLNDIVDVLEQFPLETSRYVTLLHEIDAKCVHSTPSLNDKIDAFASVEGNGGVDKKDLLGQMNALFEELMPSLEEKMHVSSIMLESLQRLTTRLELAYEIAIRNQEIPSSLRLGADNHPAMHLHHELMEKIDAKSNGAGVAGPAGAKSSQALRSESRREAMVANKRQVAVPNDAADDAAFSDFELQRRGTSMSSNGGPADTKKRKRRANVSTVALSRDDADSSKLRTNEYGEILYCYCNQVAYGEMVGCDGANCELEWFHLPCIHLDHIPKGKWYCDDCKKRKN
ncbi:hypothetical protein HG536_0D03460 [Torulaspora globosa]|uniref:Chromatin modification-related protein n=1 Tax=Torulaspora globosa TaxID=48254 RepID=A0A7G3ZH38_9SACH|nr:uncharacterized protein HG536_0D03460 [Torulaspora globosa]QLL32824.1 hypothetical protein HG536_0D03460 [Torulaspora globosa]